MNEYKLSTTRSSLRGCRSAHTPHNLRYSSLARPELTAQVQRWGLQNAGFDYDIVAVFGSQSTGKSQCTGSRSLVVFDSETRHRYFA